MILNIPVDVENHCCITGTPNPTEILNVNRDVGCHMSMLHTTINIYSERGKAGKHIETFTGNCLTHNTTLHHIQIHAHHTTCSKEEGESTSNGSTDSSLHISGSEIQTIVSKSLHSSISASSSSCSSCASRSCSFSV